MTLLALISMAIVVVIVAWFAASREILLPFNLEHALIRWKDKHQSSPLYKTIKVEEQTELIIIESINSLPKLEQIEGRRLALLISLESTEGNTERLCQCFRRRFPEVMIISSNIATNEEGF